MYDGTLKFDTSMDSSGFQKDASSLSSIVKGLGVFSLLEKGFHAVTASIDDAVSRYDTLNRFPQIMQQMGFSADETDEAMRKLSEGVQGLPTALDQVTGSAQRIASMTGDLSGAADITLALNNAFLASGATSDAASRGMEQYMQIISRGKPEMEDWTTLQETMPYALQKVAESFGFAGSSASRDFYAALKDGEITVEQMNARFVELSTATGGFAETAKTATGGIGTAWTNLKTAIVRGTANIVGSIDSGLSKTRFQSIENVIKTAASGIEATLNGLAAAFGFVAENIEPLTIAVISFGAAWAGVQLLSYIGQLGSITAAIKAMTPALLTNIAAKVTDKAETLALIAMYTKDAVVKGLDTAATAANTVVTNLSTAAASGNIIAKIGLAAATAVATAAEWAFNAALAANPVGLVIAGVVALGAALAGLISWLSKGSAAYDEQKSEIEDLSAAHEEYEEQLKSDQSAAEQTISEVRVQAEANGELVDSLRDLMNANDDAGANNEEIAQTVDALNAAVEGLGLTYDETTGALSANIDELEDYIDAQGELSVIQAQEDEYNRLLGERQSLLAKIQVEEERKNILLKQWKDGLITQREYNDLISETDDLIADYRDTEQQLAIDVEAAHAAINKSAKSSAQAQINAYEAINGALDADGRNLKQLALQYDMTTDQILAEMKEQELSMADWSEKKSSMFTEEGQSLQGVANQWGMTTDEVQACMDAWGMDLDEFAQHMKDTHTDEGLSLEDLAAKWGTTTEAIETEMDNMGLSMQEWSDQQEEAFAELEETVKEKTEGIVNSFEEIPAEFDQSAEEMLDILIHNKEQYARWEANMEEITRLLGPTAAEEFGKLGPEANSAMEEILASEELLAQYQEVFGVTIDETTGAAIEAWNDPDFIGAPVAAMESAASQISESSTLNEAAQSQVEGTKEAFDSAVETVDFGAVGSSISQAIESGMSSLNLTEVTGTITAQLRQMDTQAIVLTAEMTRGIASAISASTINIKSQMQRLGTSAVDGLKTMVSGGKNQAKLAMSQISAEIISGRTKIASQTKSLVSLVVNVLEGMSDNARATATKAMTSIVTTLAARRTAITQQASAISAGVSNALQGMIAGGRSAANQMMAGILVAMSANAQSIYNKAAQIANNVSATMRRALQVRSPSRVMIDIFRNVILGAVKGLDDMAGKAYSTASTIATGIASRLAISPETARLANAKLLSYSDAAMYRAAQPAAYAGPGRTAVQQRDGNSDLLQIAVDLLSKYLPEVANMQLVLDTGATVGGLAPAMDEALGRRARKKVRG